MYPERLKMIASLATDFQTEERQLTDALHHILQEDIRAEMDMPPFNKSAMDGYACRRKDLGNELEMVELIPAGKVPEKVVYPGQCAKIMTGAAMPEGADMVFKVEDAKELGDNKIICTDPDSKRNVCDLGEDFRKGQILLRKGLILRSEHIAVMASVGKDHVQVASMPKIGVIITGSELVEPGAVLPPGKIRNSNGHQIISLLKKIAIDSTYYGIALDDAFGLQQIFRKALLENDMVMVTGGASMGDFDLVPGILKKEGFDVLWERTGLKPGNPMSFGIRVEATSNEQPTQPSLKATAGKASKQQPTQPSLKATAGKASHQKKYFFGLSGNPVSSLVQFEYLAKPIIYQLLGGHYMPFRIRAELAVDFRRKNADRMGVLPVWIGEEGTVRDVSFNGSAHINGLAGGNALLEMEAGIKEIKKGEMAYVRPL